MKISYVPYKDIDKRKWDDCISNARHSCIYVYTIYLNALAGDWDALILNDYEAVMPLIRKSKYGIKYLYQPAFLPQTGIFSAKKITHDLTDAFVHEAFRRYKFAEIALRYPVRLDVSDKKTKTSLRNNFIIDLTDPYELISSRYTDHFSKSLRRLQKLSLRISSSENVEEIIDLFKLLYQQKTGLKETALIRFRDLCLQLQQDDNVIIRKVLDEKDQLLCAVLLLKSKNRLYNMISCVTDAGKKSEANYFLYDKIIQEFSGKEMILDLEGSNIKGIADFYLKMNPVNEQYQFVKYNALSVIARLFKK